MKRKIASQLAKAHNIHLATLTNVRIHCAFKVHEVHTHDLLAFFLLGVGCINRPGIATNTRHVLPGLRELVMASHYCNPQRGYMTRYRLLLQEIGGPA